MKRDITIYLLFFVLPLVVAAQSHQTELDRLTKEMYRLYSSHEVEQFMNITDQLKICWIYYGIQNSKTPAMS